jgi:cyanate lyase
MNKSEMSVELLRAKQRKGLTWADLGSQIGMSEIWIASVCYGESSATEEVASKLAAILELGDEVKAAMVAYPIKGSAMERAIPTDPFVYRFYEIMAVYGLALKDVVQEKFGDGIMSAIDFTLDVARESDPKGDRVVVTMNGKFLPYKRW